MPLFVVEERFEPPIDPNGVSPHDGALSPCLKSQDVKWVSSFVGQDGAQCMCIYEAPDAEAVQRAYRSAEVPFPFKVWAAKKYGG